MIPIKPNLLRILEAQCKGISNIPSLDFLTETNSLFCRNGGVPILVATFNAKIAAPTINFITGLKFNDDGSKLYLITLSGFGTIFQFSVSPNFSMSPAPTFDKAATVVTKDNQPTCLAWSNDMAGTPGDTLFVLGDEKDDIIQSPVTTPYDIGAILATQTPTLVTPLGKATGIVFSADGTKVYVSGNLGIPSKVIQYNLPTPFDTTTLPAPTPILSTVVFPDTDIRGVEISTDGSKLFVIGALLDKVLQYSMSTPFDILTLSTNPTAEFFINETNNPFGLTFSNDGTRMFIADATNEFVFEYSLPSPFQL